MMEVEKMDNKFIEIRLLNVGDCGVGLRDTQGRFYNIPMNSQLRILEKGRSI